MKKIIPCLLLSSILFHCREQLKSPVVPHDPELTGMYIKKDSGKEESIDKAKVNFLVISENKDGKPEYYFRTLVRLAFYLSEDREEIRTRSGIISTSKDEVLFMENLYEEYRRLHLGKKEKNPRLWDQKQLTEKARTLHIEKAPPSGYDKVGSYSKTTGEIRLGDDIYFRVGPKFGGMINIKSGSETIRIKNRISGFIFFMNETKKTATACLSFTEGLKQGMQFQVYTSKEQISCKITEVISEYALLDCPTEKFSQINRYDPVIPEGEISEVKQEEKTMEKLIDEIKTNKNLSKEEILQQLEKLQRK